MARPSKGQQTRERIMTTALREFAARGYQAVTMEEIAEAAGVTKGAVYHWFADKDDLGRELQHELYERLTSLALRSFDVGDDAVTVMRRGFDVFSHAVGDLGEARFFLRDAWTIPVLDEAGRSDHEDAVSMVQGFLEAASARGEILPFEPAALARILLAMWAEATLHMLTTGDRGPAGAIVGHLIESLRATPERPARGRPRRAATGGRA